MDLVRIAARVAADGPANVHVQIYDNTDVSTDELVEAVLDSGMDGPVWFSQHNFGWIAVDQDPATLTPETPVAGAPFGEKTWGETTAEEGSYAPLSELSFRPLASLPDALQDDNLLWWMTSGAEQEKGELVESLRTRGLGDLADRVAAFDI